MSGRRAPYFNSSTVSVILGIVGVIILIALVNGTTKEVIQPKPTPDPSARTAFEEQTGRPDPGFRPDSASDYTDKLARETNGDWSKLAPEDQQYINGLTAGHGAIYLRDRAKLLKASPGPKTSPKPSVH